MAALPRKPAAAAWRGSVSQHALDCSFCWCAESLICPLFRIGIAGILQAPRQAPMRLPFAHNPSLQTPQTLSGGKPTPTRASARWGRAQPGPWAQVRDTEKWERVRRQVLHKMLRRRRAKRRWVLPSLLGIYRSIPSSARPQRPASVIARNGLCHHQEIAANIWAIYCALSLISFSPRQAAKKWVPVPVLERPEAAQLPWSLAFTQRLGRHGVAKSLIPAGSCVLREQAVACVVREELLQVCPFLPPSCDDCTVPYSDKKSTQSLPIAVTEVCYFGVSSLLLR